MNEIKSILREFSSKPIAYHPIYAKITGNLTSGIMLSQLIYWHFAMKEQEFYKTNDEFKEELGMSIWDLKRAKKSLVDLKVIKTKTKGSPPITFYNVDIKKVEKLILNVSKNEVSNGANPTNQLAQIQPIEWSKSNQSIGANPTNQLAQIQPINWRKSNQSSIAENTTENTTENTADIGTSLRDVEKNNLNKVLKKSKTNKKKNKKKESEYSSEENKKISDFIYEFEVINPVISYGRKDTRNAAKILIDKFGFDTAVKMARTAISIQGKKYAPSISTPSQLQTKLGMLVSFIKREGNETASIVNDDCISSLKKSIDARNERENERKNNITK